MVLQNFFATILIVTVASSGLCFQNLDTFFFFLVIQDEYVKAYYAALIQQQQELAQKQRQEEETGGEVVAPDSDLASTSSDRQVGMKSKREEEEDEWEEEPPVAGQYIKIQIVASWSYYRNNEYLLKHVKKNAVAGNGNYKVDLNVEAAETSGGEEEEEEDIDWEEGWKEIDRSIIGSLNKGRLWTVHLVNYKKVVA